MKRPTRERREAEFEEVALVHIHSLHNLALRFTRNPADAEDLVQETFIRAFRFFDRYEPGTNAKAWLFTILRNSFINRYRKAQKRPEEVDFSKIEEVFESIVDAPRPMTLKGPEEEVLARSLDEPIETALKRLPAEYRIVLVLAVVEGFSYKEIAAVLECPIGTVMSRLHRARKHMQSQLLEYARERGMLSKEDVEENVVERQDDPEGPPRARRPETG